MESMLPGLIVLICGFIAVRVGRNKKIAPLLAFLLGAGLNVIGIIVVALLPNRAPKPPEGMTRVTCVRCNAVQNVPVGEGTFDCWQCHTTVATPAR
jgi:hypothetical protein